VSRCQEVPCQATILWLIGQVPLRRCNEEMHCRCRAEDEPLEGNACPTVTRLVLLPSARIAEGCIPCPLEEFVERVMEGGAENPSVMGAVVALPFGIGAGSGPKAWDHASCKRRSAVRIRPPALGFGRSSRPCAFRVLDDLRLLGLVTRRVADGERMNPTRRARVRANTRTRRAPGRRGPGPWPGTYCSRDSRRCPGRTIAAALCSPGGPGR
jgi:hypothetical protein